MNKERYHNIDLLKVLGTLFVVFYHSNTLDMDFLASGSALRYVNYFTKPLLSACVPLFFFANGYLLFNRDYSFRRHMTNTVRYGLLAVIWGAVILVLLMVIRKDFMTLREFVSGLFRWKQGWIDYLWYLGAHVCLNMMFPVLKGAFDHNRNVLWYFTAVAFVIVFGNRLLCMGASLMVPLNGAPFEMNFFSMFNFFGWVRSYALVYFLLGGLLGADRERIYGFLTRKNWNPDAIALGTLAAS